MLNSLIYGSEVLQEKDEWVVTVAKTDKKKKIKVIDIKPQYL